MKNTESVVTPITQMLFSLDQVSEVLGGLGRTTIFELIKTGELKVVKIGRRSFVSQRAMAEYVSSLELTNNP
jgi:excisionase family DNA binding protein